MPNSEDPLAELPLKFLFLVWGTPDQGPRSRVMADKLGFEICFVQTKLPRGALYAPIKYALQAIKTVPLLFRHRPQVIFVQSPPLLAVLLVYIYCVLVGAGYVIDAHSAAFMGPWWTLPPNWLKSLLAKNAITTLVTNKNWRQIVANLGGSSLILKDVPTIFQVDGKYPLEGNFNVAVINTFALDEPLAEVLQAAVALPEVHFYVTGKLNAKNSEPIKIAPENVHFTDFLPNEAYYSLLNTVQAVMCLTTRNHTMQRGACEALSLGKPIITSDWPILRQYFNKGTVHVDNNIAGIQQGVLQMEEHLSDFQTGIRELQLDQQREWQAKISILVSLIKRYMASKTGR